MINLDWSMINLNFTKLVENLDDRKNFADI